MFQFFNKRALNVLYIMKYCYGFETVFDFNNSGFFCDVHKPNAKENLMNLKGSKRKFHR